jgi:Bax protein
MLIKRVDDGMKMKEIEKTWTAYAIIPHMKSRMFQTGPWYPVGTIDATDSGGKTPMLKKAFFFIWVVTLLLTAHVNSLAETKAPQVVVLGTTQATIDFYKSKHFWGPIDENKPLSVPRVIVVAINDSWKHDADKLSVDLKKEFFFRAVVPMILYENHRIAGDRARLKSMVQTLKNGKSLKKDDIRWIEQLASKYDVATRKNAKEKDVFYKFLVIQLMERVDIIPPSLVLAQAASESGYATSRFTLEGNALFGQWTYGGKGMKAKAHRKEKGNYRVAAFDWPFNSLCSYVNNLNTHRAYSAFRAGRAELRNEGKTITGMALLHTLTGYSERGMAYIKDLEAIIQKNGLSIADTAKLRGGPITLVVNVNTQEDVKKVKQEIAQMRASGEFEEAIQSMGLEK